MQINKLTSFIIITTFVVALLIVGKPFLVPLFLAIGIMYLINSIDRLLRLSPVIDRLLPNWLGSTIAAIIIVLFLVGVGILIQDNINEMVHAAPDYRVNIEHQLKKVLDKFGVETDLSIQKYVSELNLNDYIRLILNSISGTTQSFFLTFIFLVFLLIEQGTFPKKLAALNLSGERKENVKAILNDINLAIRTYLTVKFLASVVTGLMSFVVLYAVGVDFSVFWAFLIFLLNFIPSIGSIIATAFPSLVTLVQFDTLTPFVIILISLVSIQLFIGSFLEPRLMGHTLNISPLIIFLSLMIWGYIWGPVGMLLCVPLTVIMILIFAEFPSTRPIAILLSKNGKINKATQFEQLRKKRKK